MIYVTTSALVTAEELDDMYANVIDTGTGLIAAITCGQFTLQTKDGSDGDVLANTLFRLARELETKQAELELQRREDAIDDLNDSSPSPASFPARLRPDHRGHGT